MPTPGSGDPYFYEWYVGLENVIKMLNPDSGISCVVFQHGEYDVIDDVVVEYADNQKQLCYQVKHEKLSSNESHLTFGSMLESKNGKKCLFAAMFLGWKSAKTKAMVPIKPILFTNRRITGVHAGRSDNGTSYKAYPVDIFVSKMRHVTITDGKISFEDEAVRHQWNELIMALSDYADDDAEVLAFLKDLTIKGNQKALAEMKASLVSEIEKNFSCDTSTALLLFGKLLIGVSKWTTSEREDERVTIEEVYSVLCIEETDDSNRHRLAPPYPFFESRQSFCDELVKNLLESSRKVMFLSGAPGSGKTSAISFLQSKFNLFDFRYHTFRPISPEQHYYNSDPGLFTPENLWGTLLDQLRKRFKGRLYENNVPVCNKILSAEKMRTHVIRLLGILGREAVASSKKVFVCIDGIDHAARAKSPVSFLSTLPMPNEIPDGVYFVIVGQPSALYFDQYPKWLATGTEIDRAEMPKLKKEDIKQLLHERATQFENDEDGIAELVFQKTEGNNLSVVFAVEEIRVFNDVNDVFQKFQKEDICSDVQQYYDHIWSHMKAELSRAIPSLAFSESVVACPILLMNGRVNTRILAEALPYGMTKADWAMVMDRLFPLVYKTELEDEYTLFHNDFRIFLMSIIQPYSAKYEEIALLLAEYLLQNNEGLVSYINGIPLLECANKKELIPRYFTPEFVIDALAEGISKQRLDAFAKTSYDVACDNEDFDGYCNTYFAIKTIYQHTQYYEYYNLPYKNNDYPDILSLDISEVRSLSLNKNNLEEYDNVLDLCMKLYSSHIEPFKDRAHALYKKWFGDVSPQSFVPLCNEDVSNDSPWEIRSTEVGFMLQHWGTVAAEMNEQLPFRRKECTEIEMYAIMLFGEQYFSQCIEQKKYALAKDAMKAGVISKKIFDEKLEDIYYGGAVCEFADALLKVELDAETPHHYFLAVSMKVISDPAYQPDQNIGDTFPVARHLFDDASFAIILMSFLLGRVGTNSDDDSLISQSDLLFESVERSEEEIDFAKCVARMAVLLGKYYWNSTPESEKFEGYSTWFLSATWQRPFEFSKSYKFLLYTLLQSKAAISLESSQQFVDALKTNLFENNSFGLPSKTYILNYLVTKGRLDPVKDYIHALYGQNCSEISSSEYKADIHAMFCCFGELVDPELMQEFSIKLKWDIAGYTGHKEYALYDPNDFFEIIAQDKTQKWQDYAYDLYRQNQFADQYDNRASQEVRNSILKAATSRGLGDYWELHNWSDEFRLDPSQLSKAVFEFVKGANGIEDLKALWILSCGIFSWYTQEERIELKAFYEECLRKAEELQADFKTFALCATPQWVKIFEHYSSLSQVRENADSFESQYAAETEAICAKYQELSVAESLEELPLINKTVRAAEHYKNVFKKVISDSASLDENLPVFFDRLCDYLQGKEWRFEQFKEIFRKIISLQGKDAFWKLAKIISKSLSDYNYQTSSRNIHLLLKLYGAEFSEEHPSLFSKEIHTQRLWISGNNHFEIDGDKNKCVSPFPIVPKSFSELTLFVLLEQIDSQNARTIESVSFALYLLGREFPEALDTLSATLSSLSQNQTETILPIIARWIAVGNCNENLLSTLILRYNACDELPMKYYLHSILLLANAPNIERDTISYDAPSRVLQLKSNGVPEDKSPYENFLRLIERYGNNVDSVREHIFSISPILHYQRDPYERPCDSQIPVIDAEVGAIFYDMEKKLKWNQIPLLQKKSSLLAIEDPFVLTEMPNMVFDENWFPQGCASNNKTENVSLPVSQLKEIANAHTTDDEMVLAASLWYPVGNRDGMVYNEASKIILTDFASVANGFDYCLGNYGLLTAEGAIEETIYSTVYDGGRSLFNRIGGCRNIYFGNCQFAPSSIWRSLLKCNPQKENPFVWTDQAGFEVMRFERIASPIREIVREPYIRQPMLFRWVCNKMWISAYLERKNLSIRKVFDLEKYP